MSFGYNIFGFNKSGYNKDGFDKMGYNKDGFDKLGYDKQGYNTAGFHKITGLNRKGFGKSGYNKAGFDKEGYDRNGYDKDGFGTDGYNREGFNIKGYNKLGFDKVGFDVNGFNIEGLDADGYNRDGFDCSGFNRDGYTVDGYHKSDFDKNGYHLLTGYNINGFDKNGFNINGIDVDGYDVDGYHVEICFNRQGFNSEGYNEEGYNCNGYNRDGYNKQGINVNGYKDGDDKYFQTCLTNYQKKTSESATNLAICYLNGKGVKKNIVKAFEILIESAFEGSLSATKILGDCYYCGDFGQPNTTISNFLYAVANGENPQTLNQYKSSDASTFNKNKQNMKDIFKLENAHLNKVIYSLDSKISSISNSIEELDKDTYWMDRDQRAYWVERNFRNFEKISEIENYGQIKHRPYYARMDTTSGGYKQTHYIGEEAYLDRAADISIVSVWSEYGQKYRARNNQKILINGITYDVKLKRTIDIKESKLVDIFDEYSKGSGYSNAQITDPYLLKVLDEKKGEAHITNIIRTIQLNQNDIIEYDFNNSLIVQGCAGSGKTMILLHRLANMKYNVEKLNLNKIKIITPNEQFNFFIDDLSKNLKIDTISKLTMKDYYFELLQRYRDATVEQKWNSKDIAREKAKMFTDDILDFDIVKIIYSQKFVDYLQDNISELKSKNRRMRYTEDDGRKTLKNMVKDALRQFLISQTIADKNYTCILYTEVLSLFLYYGRLLKADDMLCIDEGQDISLTQYNLLKNIGAGKTVFNIYGDLHQQINSIVGIEKWDKLAELINAKQFSLNENYRNSDEIIKYYNDKLGFDNLSLGVKAVAVKDMKIEYMVVSIKWHLLLKKRTAIIYKNLNKIPKEVIELCSVSKIISGKVSMLTVKEAKGLEFDTVFVFDGEMSKNEKYISYTRALEELIIAD